jgi:hypothetical protein
MAAASWATDFRMSKALAVFGMWEFRDWMTGKLSPPPDRPFPGDPVAPAGNAVAARHRSPRAFLLKTFILIENAY